MQLLWNTYPELHSSYLSIASSCRSLSSSVSLSCRSIAILFSISPVFFLSSSRILVSLASSPDPSLSSSLRCLCSCSSCHKGKSDHSSSFFLLIKLFYLPICLSLVNPANGKNKLAAYNFLVMDSATLHGTWSSKNIWRSTTRTMRQASPKLIKIVCRSNCQLGRKL